MRLSELLDTLESLDREYETIAAENAGAGGSGGAVASESGYIVEKGGASESGYIIEKTGAAERGYIIEHTSILGRRLRAPGRASGELICPNHSASHGLAHQPLTDHLASELSIWTRLSQSSPTARSILGVERVTASPDARVGAMIYLAEDQELHARFATTVGALEPTEAGRWMWATAVQESPTFRAKEGRSEPYLLFSESGTRLSFSDVRAGYEEHLRRGGNEINESALAMLTTCPTPVLLSTLSDYNARNATEHVPLAVSEAWLFDGDADQAAFSFAEPCHACKFGLSAWMCGHDEMLDRALAGRRAKVDGQMQDWLERVRNRSKQASKHVAAAVGAAAVAVTVGAGAAAASAGAGGGQAVTSGTGEAAGAAKAAESELRGGSAAEPASIATSGTAPGFDAGPAAATAAGAALTEPLKPGAAKAGAAAGAGPAEPLKPGSAKGSPEGSAAPDAGWSAAPGIEDSMLGLRQHALLDDSARQGSGGGQPAAQRGGAGQARREKVRVRIESSEFSCEGVEVRELKGKEAIGALFSFHVDIVCPEDGGLEVAQILGAAVSLVFEERDLEVRRVCGMVAEVHDRLETESQWRSYHLWIVPRVWRSTLVETQEIYLDTNVPDLIQQKLTLVGLTGSDVEMRLMGSYPIRELIAQYKETDVAFFSRLAEHLGISFFFEHDSGTDKIVFSDASSGFRPLQGAETLNFRPRGEKVDVFELEARSRAFPASFVMQEYNYRTPSLDLTSVFEAPEGFGGGVVEYGAHYKTPAEGAQLAQVRAEERSVANQYYLGKSDISQISAGGTFTLSGHTRLESANFLVVEVEHRVRQTVKGHGTGADEPYRNSFRVVDAARPYRPPRTTKRPRIAGVLTAVVEPDPSGTIGELAQIDSDGRYTVKFYFDAGDVAGRTKSSRPVRMIQGHSGPSYGIHFPLKPGIEVLIVFMDGDPDRPLIIGSVPNPITPSPVVQDVNLMNRIETASGLIIEMRDAVPPHVK